MKTLLTVPARIEEWSVVRLKLLGLLLDGGVPREVVDDMILVSEEVFVNAATHGGSGDDPRMEIHVEVENGLLTLRFEDEGRAFDPLSHPAPDLDPLDGERSIGGLGVYLVQQLTDRMTYERVRDRNQLTLERRFTQ